MTNRRRRSDIPHFQYLTKGRFDKDFFVSFPKWKQGLFSTSKQYRAGDYVFILIQTQYSGGSLTSELYPNSTEIVFPNYIIWNLLHNDLNQF